jgi:TPR repeat protein
MLALEAAMRRCLMRVTSLYLVTAALTATQAAADPAIDAAMKTCDAVAGTPLSGIPGVPEVYFSDIKIADEDFKVDMAKFKPMFDACFAAANAPNAHPRFRYQLARVQYRYTVFDFENKAFAAIAKPVIDEYAAKGWPDAQYMAAEIGLITKQAKTTGGQQAIGFNLLAAADAGHTDALAWAAQHLTQADSAIFKPKPTDPIRAAKYLAVLAKDAPTPPLTAAATQQQRVAYDSRLRRARVVANSEGFSAEEQKAAFETFKAYSDAGDENGKLSYATSLERGRATDKNLPLAMKLYEELAAPDSQVNKYIAADAAASLAGLLMTDAAGKPDPQRAKTLLEQAASADKYISPSIVAALVPMLIDGKNFVREPRRALTMLEDNSYRDESALLLADLLLQTDYNTKQDKALIEKLARMALEQSNKAAAMALGRLAASEEHPYNQAPERLKALAPFAAKDVDARMLLARLTLRNLGSSSFQIFIDAESPMTEPEVLAAINDGVAQNHPEAMITKSFLLRRGAMFPQDDRGASKLLIKAAEAGNVEAMELAADAYREGLGVKRDNKKAVKLWRAAARAGNLKAREELASNFAFLGDITLQEYVGLVMSLTANGEGFRYGESIIPTDMKLAGVFTGGRILGTEPSAIARAVLNGFRHVPAALEDNHMVAFGKAVTDEVRVAIEAELKREGFYQGEPEGFFDPEVRDAIRAYVKAKGPLVSVLAE